MKTYTVQPIANPSATHFPSPESWVEAEIAALDQHHWTDHSFHPKCEARVLYSNENLFLHFRTEEKEIATSRTQDGDEVWKDNCVEFFVSPSEDLSIPYMNFEFNMIGAMLLGVGKDRDTRKRVTADEMKSVIRKPDFTQPVVDRSDTLKTWHLQVLIPLAFIREHTGCDLQDRNDLARQLQQLRRRCPSPLLRQLEPDRNRDPGFSPPRVLWKDRFRVKRRYC